MISKEYYKFHLFCDICGEEADEIFEEFREVTSFMKNEGWQNKKLGNEWINICPNCKED